MKEVDDGSGNQAVGAPSVPDPDNGKINKDMKGLVYQGGAPVEEASSPSEDSFGGDQPKKERKKGEKDPLMSAESDTILNFTEKDSRFKAVALFIIAVVVIGVVAYFVLHSNVLKSSITVKTTSTIGSNSATTTVGHNYNKTVIGQLDLLYNYTGPTTKNGVKCSYTMTSTVSNYNGHFNATQNFPITYSVSSSACPLNINKIVAITPGFKIVSITGGISNPPLPSALPAQSSTYFVITFQAPPFSYSGPLSISFYES